MHRRILGRVDGGLPVSAIGLGCMGMSEFYGPRDDERSLAALARALELGVDFLDTADTYGLGHNEELIARAVRAHGRDRVTLATKLGIVREPGRYARGIDNAPAYLRAACEASLRRLGIDHLDLLYLHRVEPGRPIEETMEALAHLVEAGKVRHLGLCEISADTLRRAHAVHPVTSVQSEYSLWTRDPEAGLLDACRELGVGFVAYAPLGRGFLTGAVASTDTLATDDFRRANPRFADDNFAANFRIVDTVRSLARERDCTPAQVALAWLLARGDDIVPIPGTKRPRYVEENVNALSVTLDADDLTWLEHRLPPGIAVGERYTAEGMKGVGA